MNRPDLLWCEQYRPKIVQDCILPDRIKTYFQSMVDSQKLQNMILQGPPGSGKCLDGDEKITICISDELYEEIMKFLS